jgi:hypothetical protein
MTTKPKVIAVLGGRVCDKRTYQIAYNVGKGIAEQGAVLLCGGRTGVMEAACKGAAEAGGLTIGILPGNDKSDANPWVQVALPTGIGLARNAIITRACDAAIAIGGKYGTLSEIAYCLQMNKPVCGLNSWLDVADFPQFATSEEAVKFALGG